MSIGGGSPLNAHRIAQNRDNRQSSLPATIGAWHNRYRRAGLTTVPLRPGTKVPCGPGWTTARPEILDRRLTADSNLGLRAGDRGLLIVDCDDDGTAEQAWRWLEGLGVDPVGCITRRGLHFWLTVPDAPQDLVRCKLRPDDWNGDLLVHRSQGGAPPSIVDGHAYRPFGVLEAMPVVAWKDVTWLVPDPGPGPSRQDPIPVKSKGHFDLPGPVLDLVAAIREAADGAPVRWLGRTYRTRSEALYALWRSCLGLGLTPAQAAGCLGPIVGRSVRDLQADAVRSYRKLLIERSGILDRLGRDPIPDGRRDRVATDRAVWDAILQVVAQGGFGWMLHGSQVARFAGLAVRTTNRSMARLTAAGLLIPAERNDWRGWLLRLPDNG